MEYQYTTIITEAGNFTLVRVLEPQDTEIALGDHFREYFTEEVSDEDIVVVYRDPDGAHEYYSPTLVEFSDEELDRQLWNEGEWYPEI